MLQVKSTLAFSASLSLQRYRLLLFCLPAIAVWAKFPNIVQKIDLIRLQYETEYLGQFWTPNKYSEKIQLNVLEIDIKSSFDIILF